ncbi:MAG: 4-hydroxythreonine-4-phosphate dehydrogenase PdxA [Alphaproteobacteria bacterium]|nr:4-hydroxythreonine-4-phosphate dehydrogenase PdxA [Alphaproteobacteria bacterium]MDE2110308.1 4-hydroxythreonine-4-phosphate dehydrogenase PdxA [Alphaproteobacteria bacterium]MDE2494847.1 4-hydroxythreonine-4-phosphate dehydrogenase PdxA [Alphaproteobacteria bacterium]
MPTSSSVEAPPLFLTMGEPAGIGPEVAAAAFEHFNGRIGKRPLRLVGDADVLRSCGAIPRDAIVPTRANAVRTPGRPDARNAAATVEAISLAVDLAMKGEAAAIVTAPINKAVLMHEGFGFPGHTDFLAHLTGAPRAVMMLASDELRVVPLTVHIPIADVPRALDRWMIIEAAETTLAALKRDFAIAEPRLAVAGLNPHAGEDGVLGREEIDIIAPAVAELQRRGHAVTGPLPSDTMFHAEARARYDAALCMYHDQALIPIKTLSFWRGVNVTLGLPIIRTSPDHGTGFDIAGKGLADPRSMIAAVEMAAMMADARAG